jgi:formate dehydrogenase subunit beta
MSAATDQTARIRQKARELLEGKSVECVIGYERATDGVNARPLFAYEPGEVDRLIFDQTCTHNLTKYLLNRKGKSTAIVVKPCDSRAINLLLNESQIQRDKIYIIGVACTGVVERNWGQTDARLLNACQVCQQHVPVVYDFLTGEALPEPTVTEPYPDVAEMEAKSAEERRAFWEEQFSRCIRCYACRQTCPGCYCPECFAERLDPLWIGIRIAPGENEVWNTMRAFHLAGRCIGCYQCEQVCPVGIRLSLLNRKLEKEVRELFDFRAGMDPETSPPFATFRKDEKLGIGE